MKLFGIIYSLCFIICYIPQIIKLIQTKKSGDISISLFTLSVFGYISALVYVLTEIGNDVVLILNYSICLLFCLVIIFLSMKYRENYK
jgi:uncharacterized protein with PQ loop repeat